MSGRGVLLLAPSLALLLAACAATPISLGPSAREFAPEDYEDVYEAWTREADAFAWKKLRDVLHVGATFESPEFRQAYVTRYAADYAIADADRAQMLDTTLVDASEHHRFLVTLAGEHYREGDLTGARSAWRVLLVDESGRQTAAAEIERIMHPTVPERVYFPIVSHYRETFRVMFPVVGDDGRPSIDPDSASFTLVLTGARGRVELVWELSPRDRR